MKHVLVIGAGRVGRAIVHFFGAEAGYRVRIADIHPERAAAVAAELAEAEAFPGSVGDEAGLREAMADQEAVISAAPFTANVQIAKAAASAGLHYLDLTEDVKVTQAVKELAKGSSNAFVPQCGVAPGFISLAGLHVIEQLDEVEQLTLRVGALPDQPNNRLKYNLTWSTEGLVNEYLHPCEVLRGGELAMVPALEAKEEVVIEGVTYEAFTTSGGLGTLAHTYAGKVRRMDYKTMRYPGHLELIRFLLDDLGFRQRPEELVEIFHRSIPATLDDFVLISVRGLGRVDGRYEERTWWRKIEGQYLGEHFFTGIEVTTTAGVCGIAHLLLHEQPRKGLVKVEEFGFDAFMQTPFGKYYERPRPH